MLKKSLARKAENGKQLIKVNGRIIGKVVKNEFRKTIHSNWILQTPPAIATDIQALHDAERAGAVYCVFWNADTGITYRAPIAKIWDMGFTFNRGYGDQIALALPLWTQERGANHSPTTATDTTEVKPLEYKSRAVKRGTVVVNGRQLTLFGGEE
jgi:hypothetical protein